MKKWEIVREYTEVCYGRATYHVEAETEEEAVNILDEGGADHQDNETIDYGDYEEGEIYDVTILEDYDPEPEEEEEDPMEVALTKLVNANIACHLIPEKILIRLNKQDE